MPELSFAQEDPTEVAAAVLAIFATGDDHSALPGRDAAAVGTALGIDLTEELAGIGYEGELGKVARIPTRGSAQAPLLLVVGLGKAEDVTPETLRRAAGAAARNATKDATLAIVVPGDLPAQCDTATRGEAVAEGAGLGSYAYTTYRSKPTDVPSLDKITLLAGEGLDADDVTTGMRRGEVLVRATCLTRDLVNTPPMDKRPPALADRVAALAGEVGLSVKIHDEAALAEGGFGGILGVGQGSSEPPRLVELTYEPTTASVDGHVVLVGKASPSTPAGCR